MSKKHKQYFSEFEAIVALVTTQGEVGVGVFPFERTHYVPFKGEVR